MAKRQLPSPEELRQLLRYEPETGKLYWRERGPEWFASLNTHTAHRLCGNWNTRFSGKEAFTAMHMAGYRQGQILCRPYLAHRVIWAIVHGKWPEHDIDHRNGDRIDNRLCNLRCATRSENNCNKGALRKNPHGIKGVTWDARRQKWNAQIGWNGQNHKLGYFNTAQEAHEAYCAAAERLHGDFARAE